MMRRSTRRLVASLGIGLLAAMIVSFGDAAYGAQGSAIISAAVAPGSSTDTQGSFFVLHAHAGDNIRQSVIVKNGNDRTLAVNIAGVDAYTSSNTGATYGSPGSTPTHTGTWLQVTQRQIQLIAGQQRTLSFSVAVPRDAKPGQYLAGLSIAVPKEGSDAAPTPNGNQTGFVVALQAQRLIAVEIDVPGVVQSKLSVDGVHPVARGEMIELELAISNRGNGFARGRGVLTVADTGLRHEFAISTFVANTSIAMLVPWTHNAVVGRHAVAVTITNDDGRRSNWNGIVAIDQRLQARLNSLLHVAAPSVRRSGVAGASVSPTAIGGGAISVVACCAVAVRLRRRRAFREGSSRQRMI